MDCGDGAACVWQRLLKSPLVKKGGCSFNPQLSLFHLLPQKRRCGLRKLYLSV